MKRFTLAIIASTLCWSAAADIAFAYGHHKLAADGLPEIGPDERVSVFWCVAKTDTSTSQKLENCAIKLCRKFFGPPGICESNSYVMRPGHTIIAVGPKGNNQYILSKALNDSSRAEADKFVRSDKFPIGRSKIVADFYDDGKVDKTGYFVGSGPYKTASPVVTPGLPK